MTITPITPGMAVSAATATGLSTGGMGAFGVGLGSAVQDGFKLVVVGDVHSKWGAVQDVMDHEFPKGNGSLLSTGDFITYPGIRNGHRVHFVHGNHDREQQLLALHSKKHEVGATYHPLFAGEIAKLGGLSIAGLPGVFAKTYFESSERPPLKYFTRHLVDVMLSMQRSIDILLMHDAPSGIGFPSEDSPMGDPFQRSIVEHLKPRVVIFGHHHMPFLGNIGATKIIGMDYPHRSYLTLEFDPRTEKITVQRHIAKIGEEKKAKGKGYQYPWQSGISASGDSTVLFDRRIPMGLEQDIEAALQSKHRASVQSILKEKILGNVPEDANDRDRMASDRTALVLNEAIPFAAKYVAAVTEKPELATQEKEKLISTIYDQMCGKAVASSVDDLLLAFQECLKALGYRWDSAQRNDPPKSV